MLGFPNFYHGLLSKYIIAFAQVFDDIQVVRTDKTNNRIQTLDVPVGWGPIAKWIAILKSQPNKDREIQIALPRIGIEMTDIKYLEERKLNKLQKNVALHEPDGYFLKHQFAAVPYELTFNLYILTKNAFDGYQIIEQIVPFFTPEFTVSVNMIPDMSITKDCPISLVGINLEDEYEGNLSESRSIIWTLQFKMKVDLYGPIDTQGIIKKVQIDLHVAPGSGPVTDEEAANAPRSSRVTITPGLTANGQPTSNSELSIGYLEIEAEDDYGIIKDIRFYTDGKKYDPVTDEDVNIVEGNRND